MNKVLKTLFLFNGVFVLAGSLLGPLYAIYVEKINSGLMPISVSWAVFLSSATLFMWLLSKKGDKIKHKRFLLAAGYLVRAFCWLLLIFVTNIYQLIAVQFVLGIGEALGTPAFEAIFAEHLDKNKHMMDYSDWKVLSNGFLVVGTLLGGVIATNFGFPRLFILMTILALISFIGVLLNKGIDYKKPF